MTSHPVLVVEDEQAIREVLIEILEEHGLRAAPAEDGAAALAWLAENPPPCAIVLDLLMPRMNGLVFLEELRRDRPELLSTVIIASASPDMIRKAAEYGVAGTLAKPFDVDALLERVERLCEAVEKGAPWSSR